MFTNQIIYVYVKYNSNLINIIVVNLEKFNFFL